jgi:hypothetical protein
MKSKPKERRRVLVILKNRFTPTKPGHYVELECAPDGAIHKEKVLRREPKQPAYDEVWVNDEGKRSINDCTRFKRIYRHALERQA